MKNFQRNLFVIIAIALCGTCAYQWYLQGSQFNVIQHQNQIIYNSSVAIQGFTNTIKLGDDQISQLQNRVTELKDTLASNDQWAINEKREVARLSSASDLMSNEIAQYKDGVAKLEVAVSNAYQGEKELAAQRNDLAERLNASIQAQNKLTSNFNDLVGRYNKLVTTTNAPTNQ